MFTHMFGAFSKLFKKSEPASAPTRSSTSQTAASAARGTSSPVSKDETGVRTQVPRTAAAPIKSGDALTIPYSAIIKVIPQELWGKLAPAGVAGYNYTVSIRSVQEQLPHGAVKANFGELRRAAPNGVFVNTSAEDSRMVDLPLSEILALLHPDSLSLRPDQTRKAVSAEVPDLFGAKGERLAPLRVMEKKEVSTTTIARQKGATTVTNKTAVPAAPEPPHAPVAPSSPIRMQPAPAANQPTVLPSRAPASVPIPVQKISGPPSNAARSLPKLPAAAPAKPEVPAPASNTGAFLIALDIIAANWPDGIRQELAQLKIPDAKVALPSNELCEGLKRGRIQYPWRTLRAWMQPTPIYATDSPHDDTVLELPLRTLTPLFLDFIRSNPVNRQSADAENITEFFRRAEQVSGTSSELLQPLVAAPGSAPVPAAAVPNAASSTAGPNQLVVENDALCLPVSVLSNSCPEPVQHDIASFGLAASRVEIPLGSIEPGLKTGRIEFTWRELSNWLNPPSKPAQVSINGEHRISLPLGLIAPVFMKARGSAQTRRRTNVDQEIPDLFSANGKPLAAAAAVPQDAPLAPAPSTPPSAPAAAQVAKKAPTNLSELFNEPSKKSWTPNEIVQYSTKLPKVAGTLIALQDGLMVAANMPPDLKTETIAAFVPQIFGRMNQYTKELQMGDTTAVSFNVECGTIQVYNAGIIYFAAFARKGDLLPLAELQLIAGELSRHTK